MKNIEEIWTLIAWLDFFKKDQICLKAVDFVKHEVCLENLAANISYNFSLENKKQINAANKALTLWANKSVRATTDFEGKSLFDLSDWSKINSG